MERKGVLINLDVTALWIGDQDASSTPVVVVRRRERKAVIDTHLSVAILSLAIDITSSRLAALLPPALRLVRGVLPPFGESVIDDAVWSLAPVVAAFFAAFSASRFCFEEDGAIVDIVD